MLVPCTFEITELRGSQVIPGMSSIICQPPSIQKPFRFHCWTGIGQMSINRPSNQEAAVQRTFHLLNRDYYGVGYCYTVIVLVRSVAAASFNCTILHGFYLRAATNWERNSLNSALSVKPFVNVRALRKASFIRITCFWSKPSSFLISLHFATN